MRNGSTVWEKLAAVAVQLTAKHGSFSTADLAVAAWQAWPRVFGLKDYEGLYPDSNRCVCEVVGKKGLVARGVLERVGVGLYRSTRGKETVNASVEPKKA